MKYLFEGILGDYEIFHTQYVQSERRYSKNFLKLTNRLLIEFELQYLD